MDLRDPNNRVQIIEYSFNYAYSTDKKLKNYLSLLVCTAGVVFLFPPIAVLGYLSKLRNSIIHEEPIPNFEDYENLYNQGKKSLIVYLPPIFLLGFALLAAQYLYLLIGFVIVPFFISPVISMKFSEHMEIDRVYDAELIRMLLSSIYIKYFFGYLFINIYFIVSMIVVGALTLGIAFILFIPVFLTFRTCYWGYAQEEIRSDLETGD